MPAKKSINKMSTSDKVSDKLSDKVSKYNSDTESDNSDNESKTLKNKVALSKIKAKPIDDDSEDIDESSDDDDKVESSNIKAGAIEDDSEEIENESDNDSGSESESDNQDKKIKEKKSKDSFDEILKKLDIIQSNIKIIDKEISETKKILKIKEKSRSDYERQRNALFKLLPKTHNDEVTKARKQKTKRPGNVTGGFCSLQPVPDILVKFLDLKEDETCLKRPQVTSRLSNKFSAMGLKKGQDTILSKEVVKELELDKSYIGKVINFGEFQTFLKGFYQVKEKNIVSVV